jgi:hypothetical protein
MGAVLEATHGLAVLTGFVFGGMEPFLTNIVMTTIAMYWTAVVYHFMLASEISMLGTSIPLVMQLAKTHVLNPLHDLDVCRGRQAVRLPIRRPHHRLLLRLFFCSRATFSFWAAC